MNLTLVRTDFDADGIYSILTDNLGVLIAHCLEHSYDAGAGNGSYAPKIPNGTYTCQRSMHRLHNMPHDFETFQVMDVPNHSSILFHWGNYNNDSDGCILVGRKVTIGPGGVHMITDSKDTFAKFMALQHDIDTFTLTIY